MEIVRYADSGGTRVGARDATGIVPLPGVTTISELLRLPRDRFDDALRSASRGPAVVGRPLVLPPVDGRMEVWGGGVTYERSRAARVEESDSADIYDRVYVAHRPELFLKAPAWRVITDGDPIAIRRDSPLNVPEPELAVCVNRHGEVVGYLVCNDMTSRSIEAENPLYLPQAKIYARSCALSSGIVPHWEVPDPDALEIAMTIHRASGPDWQASTSTARMKRSIEELVRWTYAESDFPDGAIVSTGTGIVPELDFVLAEGDRVEIRVEGVGVLSNQVAVGPAGATGEEPADVATLSRS